MHLSPIHKRPPLEHGYPYTRAQKWLEGLSILLLLGTLLALVLMLPGQLERVPVHFGADGTPNRFGSPLELVWLWVTLLGMYLGLGAMAWRLHRFWPYLNWPEETTLERDPRRAYLGIRSLLLGLRLLVCAVFALALTQSVLSALGTPLRFVWLVLALPLSLPFLIGFWAFRFSTPSSKTP